jgi:hypothetical protein
LSCSINLIIIQPQPKAKRPSNSAMTMTGMTPRILAGRGGGHFFNSSGGVL